jgi:YVTN family beta-propeller protein
MKTHCLLSKKALLLALGFFATQVFPASAPLTLQEPVIVPDSKGGFDYLQVDAPARRLLANHTANNTLDVLDLDSGKLIKHISTGKAQGVAVVTDAGRYYVSVSREKIVVIIDSKTLTKIGEIKLDGPADAIVYDPKNQCLYVCHDDNTDLWVIDTKTDKIVASIKIAEGPEYVVYDSESDRVFQNIKSNDTLLVIDPTSNTIKQTWPTAPARNPHGLAYSAKTKRLYCAGTNGKLAVMDAQTGKVLETVDIAKGVDQIVFDPEKRRVYCGCGSGFVSVLEETEESAKSLGNIKTAPGAKTITFDPKTHAVWVAYADKEHSYVRKLTPE